MVRGWPPHYEHKGGRHNPKNKAVYKRALENLRKFQKRKAGTNAHYVPVVCKFWQKDGNCRFGSDCIYQHPLKKNLKDK
jgi:hypothetical protein